MEEKIKVRNYKDLKVWKLGIEIVDSIYDLTRNFPAEERYGLASQMQRAAVAIPSNIAEGFARQHSKEYQQFCYIALGSCAELETQIVIAARRHYLADDFKTKLTDMIEHESRMLTNLIKSIKGKRENGF